MKTILEALKVFVPAGSVVELRAVEVAKGNGYTENRTGYFDDMAKMAAAAKALDGKAPGIYFTLNPCDPRLLGRAANKVVVAKAGKTTADHNIIKRSWLPIDCDAKRPAGVSATDKEHADALAVTLEVVKYLSARGWPRPILGDSGNGGHACYRIDLPNDADSLELVKAFVEHIGNRFDSPTVDIDRKVVNAARIWKLYGTVAAKGDSTPNQPHRRARVVDAGGNDIVTADMIRALVGPKEEKAQPKPSHRVGGSIDVEAFCGRHGLTISKHAPWNDAEKFILTPCPFNSDHAEAAIIKHPSGAVSFECFHNGCNGKDWQALREKFEPRQERQQRQILAPPPPRIWTPEEENDESPILDRIDPAKDLSEMQSELEQQIQGKMCSVPLPWSHLSRQSDALRPGCVCILSGPTKVGKSYLIMNLIRDIHWKGLPWKYLPLEDDRKQWAWRMLAILEGDYSMTSAMPEDAERRMMVMARRKAELEGYLRNVSENPRAGIKNAAGETVVPEVPYKIVVDWAKQAVKKARLVVIDPHAQIDFNGRDVQRQESALTRELLGIVAGRDCTIILITHLRKTQGGANEAPVTADDVQGSANLTRLPQTTLVLLAHEMKPATLLRAGGLREEVMHNRTLLIAAARNAGGTRKKIAFIQSHTEPEFSELGIIDQSPKGRGR